MFDAFPVVMCKVCYSNYLTLLRNIPPFQMMLLSVFLKSKSECFIDEQILSHLVLGLFFAHAANFMLAKEEIPNSIWRPTTRRGTKKGKKRMPILNRVAEMQEEVAGWRRHLHEHPELLYDVYETSKFVAEKLKSFGCDVVETGIGKTGVVGIIKGRHGDGPTIGFRSDMDALPILETSGKPWASKTPGKAHSCGHDGHTAMLLGAAQYLAETRNFKGSVAVIFQPAEEGGAGALAMLNDGMMEKFGISQVYGMHNEPGIPVGQFAIRKGSTMAAADSFEITITGKGSHAAAPHLSIDPVLTSAHIIIALQSARDGSVEITRRHRGHHPWRHGVQRHSRCGDADRHRAHAAAGDPRFRRKAPQGSGRRHRHGSWRDGGGEIRSRLSRHVQPQ